MATQAMQANITKISNAEKKAVSIGVAVISEIRVHIREHPNKRICMNQNLGDNDNGQKEDNA